MCVSGRKGLQMGMEEIKAKERKGYFQFQRLNYGKVIQDDLNELSISTNSNPHPQEGGEKGGGLTYCSHSVSGGRAIFRDAKYH